MGNGEIRLVESEPRLSKNVTMNQICPFRTHMKLSKIIIAALPCLVFCCGQNDREMKFLLLDNRNIKAVDNAELVVGTVEKSPHNPLFTEDKAWEKRYDNFYGNVWYDEDEKMYKCWYSPFIVDDSAVGMTLEERQKPYHCPDGREMAILYAASEDGIHWIKPELGLVEYEGGKANNIVWRSRKRAGEHWAGPHGAGIFHDERETNPTRKYKALFMLQNLSIGFSADGLHWNEYRSCEGDVTVAGDTHNNAFWAPTLNKYVGITRTWGPEGREVARIESDDFIHWTKEEVVMKGLTADAQPYAMPVFYYEGVYLGLIAVYIQDIDRVQTELAWSPDTKAWHRISPGKALIPLSEKVLDYDYGCIYPCACPIMAKDGIKLYYGGSDYLHLGWRTGALCLAKLRPDGFAGWEAKDKAADATVETRTFAMTGKHLRISADIEEGGSLKIAVLDEQGRIIPGFSAENCDEIPAYAVHAEVKWKGRNLSGLNGRKIAFRLVMDNAKVYSLSGNMK